MTRQTTVTHAELARMAEIANAKGVIIEMTVGAKTVRVRPDRALDDQSGEDEVERAIAAFEAKHGRG